MIEFLITAVAFAAAGFALGRVGYAKIDSTLVKTVAELKSKI